MMAVNVKGVFLGLKYVLQQMLRQRAAARSSIPRPSPAWWDRPACRPMSPPSMRCIGLTKTASGEVARPASG